MAQIRERFTLLQDFEELREKVDKDEPIDYLQFKPKDITLDIGGNH